MKTKEEELKKEILEKVKYSKLGEPYNSEAWSNEFTIPQIGDLFFKAGQLASTERCLKMIEEFVNKHYAYFSLDKEYVELKFKELTKKVTEEKE